MKQGIRKLPRLFWAILVVYFLLATVYATVTPLFEKPDENWHFAAAMYILEEGRLPQNTSDNPDHYARQQANQAPLYYMSLAAVWRLSGLQHLTNGYLTLANENEQVSLGRPKMTSDNRRHFIHGRCEGECARSETAAYIARAVSVLFVGVSVLFSSLALQTVFPKNTPLILLTSALIGFNPQILHIGSSVSNDSLTVLTMSIGIYLGARWLNGARSRRMVIIMGIVAGAALLTKLSAGALGLILGLTILLTSQKRLHDLGVFGVVSLGISGWWFVYNTLLYGSLTAINVHLNVATQSFQQLTLTDILYQLRTVIRSFWAEFGWTDVFLPTDLYNVIVLLISASLTVGVVYFVVRWRMLTKAQRQFILLASGIMGVVFVLLLRWMTLTQAPHGRLLFPAVLPISMFMAVGLINLVANRWRPYLTAVLSLGLLTFAIWMVIAFIHPAYTPPPPVTEPQTGSAQMTLREPDGGQVAVRDIALVHSPDLSYVQITWQIREQFKEDYLVFVHALNAEGERVAQIDTYPGLSNKPFTRMPIDEVFHDVYPIQTPEDMVETLQIGVYDAETWERLPAESERFRVKADNATVVPVEQIRTETIQ